MKYPTLIGRLCAVIALAIASGCATTPPAPTDPLAAAPEDFSLDVTVMTGRDVDGQAQARVFRGRYVLLADGSLHQGRDTGGTWGARWLPEQTRILSRGEVAHVWSHAQQLGLTDPNRKDDISNPYLVMPQAGHVTYLALFTGAGQRWGFAREIAISGPRDAAVTALAALVKELARLSWTEDRIAPEGYVAPLRYDHGPDPYAKYRRVGDKGP